MFQIFIVKTKVLNWSFQYSKSNIVLDANSLLETVNQYLLIIIGNSQVLEIFWPFETCDGANIFKTA